MRTFTLPEAQTLLPVLDSLLQRAQAAATVATTRENALRGLSQAIFLSGGLRVDLPEVARIKAEHSAAITEAKDTLEEISSIGVEVHDLAGGLLEFPFQLGDEIVMLCWLQGDKNITQWHSAESGWDERQPLDDRFTRGDRPQ
ncbi:DUF2203 domain-containing protein [Terriglobus roseus]|uniref:DUF2203 domain-containing protein n=1 Tax=Terriglobus roseus TaxID=392734 RepID=A0A1H4KXG5_9BACT|nr:DUF2203 domain-containing protein [Terriglobus roseus]SEB63187.1 hypothetical protein SAMN05443244_1393 [Terriglobus roseus]